MNGKMNRLLFQVKEGKVYEAHSSNKNTPNTRKSVQQLWGEFFVHWSTSGIAL
jgi:phage antirepressor YoqD-like protein